MPGYSFPPDDNAPIFNDIPLGPTDRMRGWLGWTYEDWMLRSDARRTLRQENGTLIYGDNSPSSTVEDFPIVVDQ